MRATQGPDFVCIGQAKAGTGWLYDQLAWHSEAWMPPFKELQFFGTANLRSPVRSRRAKEILGNTERRVAADGWPGYNAWRASRNRAPLGERDLRFLQTWIAATGSTRDADWYADLFREKAGQISGDVSPQYALCATETVEAIRQRFPELRIVLFVRDPVERTLSHLQHVRRRQRPDAKRLDTASRESISNFLDDPDMHARSLGSVTYRRWQSVFGDDRVHVELFDDLAASPEQVRQRIFSFLGLAPSSSTLPADLNRKKAQPKFPLAPETYRLVLDRYRDEIVACARLFGGAASRWPEKHGLSA